MARLKLSTTRLRIGNSVADSVPDDLLFRRRAITRHLKDSRQAANAIEQIGELPLVGESLHFIVDGRFEPCDLIAATHDMSGLDIARLSITTLGVNNDNVASIAEGMDQGWIKDCSVLISSYFYRVSSPEFEYLENEIKTKRGGRTHAMNTHAKIILMEMSDGACFTIEGSGNLRSCQSIEQFVMTNDRALYEFHNGWIEDYIVSCGGKNTTGKRSRK